jgi:hypothetical protein
MHKEGARDVEVYTVIFGEKVWTHDELADLFVAKAMDHVAEVPGTQLFTLFAHYGDRQPVRRGFRINNTDTEFGYGGTTEPPTPTGEKMQGMRHNEFMFQQNMKHTQFLMKLQYDLLSQVSAQNSKLMSENHDALEIAKVTILQAAKIEADRLLQEGDKSMQKDFVKMLPAMINRATGMEIMPENVVNNAFLESMLDKIDTEEKLQQVAQLFGPEAAGYIAMRKAKELEGKSRALESAKRVATANGKTEFDDDDLDNADLPH